MMKPDNNSNTDKPKVKPWSVRDSKVNLAALLNDPRKAKRDYDLFTKTWGVEFRDLPPGATLRRSKWIPNVQSGHFTEYLENTGDRVLRHESQSFKFLEDDSTSKEFQSVYGTGHNQHTKAAIKTAITAHQQRDAVIKTRAALDAIPKIFLRNDFTLQNSHTFTSVLNFNDSNSSEGDPELKKSAREIKRQISSSKLLQEKLSHYLDMVEMAIIRQISLQSDAFFNAMSSHDKLHEQLNETLSKVQNLIKKMKIIESNIVSNPLKIVQLKRVQSNQINLLEKLHMMVTVHQTQPTIQLLLSTSEYAGSLDLITTTQEVLHQELSGIHCFRHLSSQLHEMENVIDHMMHKEVEEVLKSEVQRPLTQGHHCAEPHRLTAVVLGLLRQGQFDFLEGFRGDIEIAVKAIIKDTVCDVIESSLNEENQSLASRMRRLSWDDWMQMLTKIFNNLISLLRKIKSILNMISSVAKESLARGDIYKTPQYLKSNKNKQKTLKTSKFRRNLETTNAFSDNNSESETNDDKNNPISKNFQLPNGKKGNSRKNSKTDERNPFSEKNPPKLENSNPFLPSVSPEKNSLSKNRRKSTGNPFLDEINNENTDLMEGLASYEDELINSAADLYDNSSPKKPDKNEPQLNGNTDVVESSNENSEDQETEEQEQVEVVEKMSSLEYETLEKYLTDLLGWVFDFQQDRCVKVLAAKGKDGSLDKLSSGNFLLLAKSIKRFTNQAEIIVKRKTETETLNSPDQESPSHGNNTILNGSLRGALQTQASRFVSRFHEERRNKLSLILDNENWKQAEVPAELTTLLDNLVNGKLNQNNEKPVVTNGNSNHNSTPPATNTVARATELLVLNGEKFAVVGTVLIMLKMVSEYCKCSDDLPASTADLVHRLHDLLTLFNSRTCQLVLGAGALQLVGLKTITTKNLALASRCLQLVLFCLPSIRSHFETKVLTYNQHNKDANHKETNVPHKHKAVLKHFDHVTKDYQAHVDEIEHKFNVIVSGVVDRYLTKWEVKAPMPSPSFRQICKQITKFHETVSSLLPQKQTLRIILSVNEEFKQSLKENLIKYGVTNNGGPQHGLVTSDLSFYDANIKNLPGMASIDLKLHTVWS